jgi:hypothetical protein
MLRFRNRTAKSAFCVAKLWHFIATMQILSDRTPISCDQQLRGTLGKFDRRNAMKKLLLTCIMVSFGLLACRATAVQQSGSDPLTGTWLGDFGPGHFDRNTIGLDLKWDGKNLIGTIKPGDPRGRMYRNFTPIPIQKPTFDPKTNTIKFEALFEPRDRTYIIEGKVDGDTISGTWTRPTESRNGDFKLTRQKATGD